MTVEDLNSVTLSDPVKVDGKKVTKITLRRPHSGELRGLKLTDILQMDVDTMIRLLPRITTPPLSEVQVDRLPPDDLTDLSVKTTLFFAKRRQIEGQTLTLEG